MLSLSSNFGRRHIFVLLWIVMTIVCFYFYRNYGNAAIGASTILKFVSCALYDPYTECGFNMSPNMGFMGHVLFTGGHLVKPTHMILTNFVGRWMEVRKFPGKLDRETPHKVVILGAGVTGLGAVQRLKELKRNFTNLSVIVLEEDNGPVDSARDEHGFLWDSGATDVTSHYDYFSRTLDQVVPHWTHLPRSEFAYNEIIDGVEHTIPLYKFTYLHHANNGQKTNNFEDWVMKNFAKGQNEKYLKKYYEKFWRMNTTMLNLEWLSALDGMGLPQKITLKSGKASKFDSTENNKPANKLWNKISRCPKFGGIGGMWKRVTELQPQGWFRYNSKVTQVNLDSKAVVFTNNGKTESFNYDFLISTIPLDSLLKIIKTVDRTLTEKQKYGSKLVYSRAHLVGLGLSGKVSNILKNKPTVFFPDSGSPLFKLTVLSSYSNDYVRTPASQWSVMCEIIEPESKSERKNWERENVIKRTISALVRYGFIEEKMIISKYYRKINHAYPVPRKNRDEILTKIQPWLESKNIFSRGSFGGWKYEVSNQDHSFMQGVEIVDFLLNGVPEETYQNPELVNSMNASPRLIKDSESFMDFEFVVAHYNEPFDWLKPFANISHVYHKGKLNSPPFKVFKFQKIRNVGREAHTYLYHIIKNYDNLANLTVFLQGHGPEPRAACYGAMEFVKMAKKGIFCKVVSTQSNWNRIQHIDYWLRDWKSGKMKHAEMNIADFYSTLFKKNHPPSTPRCMAGCFSATRNNIRKRPKSFYETAIKFVNDHPNPEEAHYFERLWCHIINP